MGSFSSRGVPTPIVVGASSSWEVAQEPTRVIAPPMAMAIIALSLFTHMGVVMLLRQHEPSVLIEPPKVPEMAIEFAAPPPPPPPVEETPPPEPVEEVKPVVEDAPAPPPKPKPKPAPKPQPKPKPKPVEPTPAPQPPVPAPPAPPAPAKPVQDTPPNAGAAGLHNPPPNYPLQAQRRGQEGTTVLKIRVLANGRAGEVQIQRSSGFEMLDNAAVEAVRQWKFVPAKRGDTPVDGWVAVPLTFKMN